MGEERAANKESRDIRKCKGSDREDMPDRMSEDIPDRMSEDMPDRMPGRYAR